MEEERAGAAAERSCVLLYIINYDSVKEGGVFALPVPKAATAQNFFAPVRGPDCALWTAQSFALRSR
jgi:hypothetical protein